MGNQIKVAIMNSIITLYGRGWSQRKIARELGLDRETVRRHIRLKQLESSKPAIPTAGNSSPEVSKPAIPTTGKSGRKSQCEPYREQIEKKFSQGLSGQRIYQDLKYEQGFPGTYEAVKRFVRHLRQVHPDRIYRIESPPGEEAQVDFGRGAPIRGADGKRRISHVIRVVLSYSRKAYSECVFHQTTELFIRCLENAFRAFGGVPRSINLDNLKAGVKNADWFDPEINPKAEEFARYYGTVFTPIRPRTPEHNGKAESGVKYVKGNALKGREFSGLREENEFLRDWEAKVADCRIHGTTRKQVGKVFEEEEKAALLPLPAMLFPCFEEGERLVHRDSYVQVENAYYEVPEEYIGRKVWVRWDSRLVRIFNHRFEQIEVKTRLEPGKFSRCLSTRGARSSVEQTSQYWLNRAARIGKHTGQWAIGVMGSRGPLGIRVLLGLLSLSAKHSTRAIDRACELAVAQGAYRLRDLRRLLALPERQETFTFLESHPLIRDISEYGDLLQKLQEEKTVNRE